MQSASAFSLRGEPRRSSAGARSRRGEGLVAVLHRVEARPRARRLAADAPSIARRLEGGSYAVVDVPITRATIDRLVDLAPDVVVVVHEPPGFDVVRLCHDLRASLPSRIVVVATPPLPEPIVVQALDAGADDIVSGAMSTAVLDARIRVALRAHPPQVRTPRLEVGDVVVDLRAHRVTIAGEEVRCPPVQFVLLATLAESPNVAIGRDELLWAVWGERPGDVHPRRLRIAVSLLRDILGAGPRRPVIETLPRLGYRLSTATAAGR